MISSFILRFSFIKPLCRNIKSCLYDMILSIMKQINNLFSIVLHVEYHQRDGGLVIRGEGAVHAVQVRDT